MIMVKKKNSNRTIFQFLTLGLMIFSSVFITACKDDDDIPNLIPVITSFSPESGEEGDQVTITGTDLGNATAVRFGSVDATIASNSATQIVTTVPAGATTGKITVITAGGTAVSGANFEVISVGAPTVAGISTISAQEGETITITGTELTTVSSVQIGGVAATIGNITDTSVEVTVGPNTPLGLSAIQITNEGGTTTTSTETMKFYVVDVYEKFSDTFDRESPTFTSGGHAEISAWGINNNLTTVAGYTPHMVPSPISGKFYHIEGVSNPSASGTYAGMLGFSKQSAGSMADFFRPGTDPEEYYFNFQMHVNDPANYDDVLVGLRLRFEEGYDVDNDGSNTDEHLEFQPTPSMLKEMGFTPNGNGWYTLSIPFNLFTEAAPKGASWSTYDVDQMTRFVFAVRRKHDGEYSLSIDNVFITRGGPYNFANPE